MRIDLITLKDIEFSYVPYDVTLKESLLRVGQNFPIYVKREESRYRCHDGNKRLSAMQDILKEEPTHPKFQTIKVILMEGARTAPPYSLHNHH